MRTVSTFNSAVSDSVNKSQENLMMSSVILCITDAMFISRICTTALIMMFLNVPERCMLQMSVSFRSAELHLN